MTHLYKHHNGSERIFTNEREFPNPSAYMGSRTMYNASLADWLASCTPPEGIEVHPEEVRAFLKQIMGDPYSSKNTEAGVVIPGECFEVREEYTGQRVVKYDGIPSHVETYHQDFAFFRSPEKPAEAQEETNKQVAVRLAEEMKLDDPGKCYLYRSGVYDGLEYASARIRVLESDYIVLLAIAEEMKVAVEDYANTAPGNRDYAFVQLAKALAKFAEFKKQR